MISLYGGRVHLTGKEWDFNAFDKVHFLSYIGCLECLYLGHVFLFKVVEVRSHKLPASTVLKLVYLGLNIWYKDYVISVIWTLIKDF